jgi:hypothetical protein
VVAVSISVNVIARLLALIDDTPSSVPPFRKARIMGNVLPFPMVRHVPSRVVLDREAIPIGITIDPAVNPNALIGKSSSRIAFPKAATVS